MYFLLIIYPKFLSLKHVYIIYRNLFIIYRTEIMNNFSQRKEPKINALSVVVATFCFFVYYMPNLAHTRKLVSNLISLNSPSLPGGGVDVHM